MLLYSTRPNSRLFKAFPSRAHPQNLLFTQHVHKETCSHHITKKNPFSHLELGLNSSFLYIATAGVTRLVDGGSFSLFLGPVLLYCRPVLKFLVIASCRSLFLAGSRGINNRRFISSCGPRNIEHAFVVHYILFSTIPSRTKTRES